MLNLIISSILIVPLLSYAEILEGVAKNNKGEIIYLEKHTIDKDSEGLNKKIQVEYKNPKGEIFATMQSDFSKNRNLPETIFEDRRFKTKTMIRVTSSQIEFEEFKDDKSISKKAFSIEDSMVASQGFDNFIFQNATKMESKPVEFKFGVLDSKDFYTLTSYKRPTSSSDEIQYGIKASNWLLSLFASELKVVYTAKDRKLKTFAGRSNIMDDRGKSQDVTISYSWKQNDEK